MHHDTYCCCFACGALGSCAARVVCPAGVPCKVTCGQSACAGGIDCTKASACDLGCVGYGSCNGAIGCAGSRCDVRCAGQSSCASTVTCDAGERCDVDCSAYGSCYGAVRAHAKDSVIHCTGQASCTNVVDCAGLGSCAVECTSYGACYGKVTANGAAGSDVRCTAQTSCSGGVQATSADASIACTGDRVVDWNAVARPGEVTVLTQPALLGTLGLMPWLSGFYDRARGGRYGLIVLAIPGGIYDNRVRLNERFNLPYTPDMAAVYLEAP